MKKKIVIISILVVFALVTISTVSAINAEKLSEKKESPLYSARITRAINENSQRTAIKFLRNRIYLAFPLITKISLSQRESVPTWFSEGIACLTCIPICGKTGIQTNDQDTEVRDKIQLKTGFLTSCPSFNCICL